MALKATTVHLEEIDHEWLRAEAFRRRVSMSKIIAELIDYARSIEARDADSAGQ